MEMIASIQKAIDYIENNLVNELDIATIASQARMSSSHFQRIFLAVCGMSVGDYIRSRKLALAGVEVVATSAKIIDIAHKYGYETPEGFSRAFARFHNTSPTAARSRGDVNTFAKISIISMLRREDVMETQKNLACSFCGKSQSDAKVLVTGNDVCICEKCISLCGNIVETELN